MLKAELESYLRIKSTTNFSEVSEDSLKILLSQFTIDSLKNELLFDISYNFLQNNDSTNFLLWNEKALETSKIRLDTLSMAEANWDLGHYHFYRNNYDRAYGYYNNAYKLYLSGNNDYFADRMLLNQALVQGTVRDYLGSEIATMEAIRIFKPLQKHKQLYLSYNNLGIIFNELEEFSTSLKYHNIALDYNQILENNYYSLTTLNNIGVAHKKMGEFRDAEKYFLKGLAQVKDGNNRVHAMLLGNLGHVHVLNGNFKEGLELMTKSLAIREDIGHLNGIIINKIHLAEYYTLTGDTSLAVTNLYEASKVSEETNNFRDLLMSLKYLSTLDRERSDRYLSRYIRLNDSLSKEERKLQNKFARIRFETDEVIEESVHLTEQRKWLLFGSGGVIFFIALLYVIRIQNARNRRLQLEKEQQKSNEKIYDLLLDSQQKFEAGSQKEKQRISRELHDGVLSKFFGIRLNLELLNSKEDSQAKNKRKHLLRELKSLEGDIRNISHELSADDFINDGSFTRIILDLFEEIELNESFEISFNSSSIVDWNMVCSNRKINLYRILQESLQNVRKYAKARRVWVNFLVEDEFLILEIIDDGCGFKFSKPQKGIGLKNIENRAKMMNGKFKLKSGKDGTTLKVILPFEKE